MSRHTWKYRYILQDSPLLIKKICTVGVTITSEAKIRYLHYVRVFRKPQLLNKIRFSLYALIYTEQREQRRPLVARQEIHLAARHWGFNFHVNTLNIIKVRARW